MKLLEIIIGVLLAVYSVLTATRWKDLRNRGRVFVIISVIGAIVIGINLIVDYRKTQKKEKIEATYGDIGMNQSVDYPILKIGDDSSAVFLPDKDGYIYFEVWNLKSYFRIYTKNNSLHLTTVIRNLEGKAIASVVDNEWEKIKLAEGFDFNNDNSGFEIIEKGDRNVIFQIDLRNGVAYFSGFIIDSDGSGICLTKLAGSTIYNTAIVRVVPGTKVAYPKTHIKPLFKYPRERYLGIRND